MIVARFFRSSPLGGLCALLLLVLASVAVMAERLRHMNERLKQALGGLSVRGKRPKSG